jgi:hypothetical protein
MSELNSFLETDVGVDFRTKRRITLTPDATVVDNYAAEIRDLVENASHSGYSFTTIDECLHLIALKAQMYRGKRLLVPSFYFMANPHFVQAQMTSTDLTAAWEAFAKNAPIVDMVQLSMRVPCAHSIFTWISMPRTMQVDLVLGKQRLLGYFDIEKFCTLLRERGMTVSWLSGTPEQEYRRMSTRIPGSPKAYALKVELQSGLVQNLLNGFFSRVFLYLTKPYSLIKMIESYDSQKDKIFNDQSRLEPS